VVADAAFRFDVAEVCRRQSADEQVVLRVAARTIDGRHRERLFGSAIGDARVIAAADYECEEGNRCYGGYANGEAVRHESRPSMVEGRPALFRRREFRSSRAARSHSKNRNKFVSRI